MTFSFLWPYHTTGKILSLDVQYIFYDAFHIVKFVKVIEQLYSCMGYLFVITNISKLYVAIRFG